MKGIASIVNTRQHNCMSLTPGSIVDKAEVTNGLHAANAGASEFSVCTGTTGNGFSGVGEQAATTPWRGLSVDG